VGLEVSRGIIHFTFSLVMSLLGRASSERKKHKPRSIDHDSYVGPIQSTKPIAGWVAKKLMESNTDYRTYFLNRYDRLS
jgi:hypothetical protein